MPVLALFVPSASQCFAVLGPIVSIIALVWLMRHGHEVIENLFPKWEWEKKLGWLNLRAQRRAEGMLRWVRYAVQTVLLVALSVIVWVSYLFGNFDQWNDVQAVAYLIIHLEILAASLIAWIVYLTLALAPHIREDYEREGLERFRRDHSDPAQAEAAGRRRDTGNISVWGELPAATPPRRRPTRF